MKTHNVAIYHCLRCGNVNHRELDLDVPNCCGRKMAKSAEETVYESDPISSSRPETGGTIGSRAHPVLQHQC